LRVLLSLFKKVREDEKFLEKEATSSSRWDASGGMVMDLSICRRW
jgi:hypothetical protein